jgi:hypothetical protein
MVAAVRPSIDRRTAGLTPSRTMLPALSPEFGRAETELEVAPAGMPRDWPCIRLPAAGSTRASGAGRRAARAGDFRGGGHMPS